MSVLFTAILSGRLDTQRTPNSDSAARSPLGPVSQAYIMIGGCQGGATLAACRGQIFRRSPASLIGRTTPLFIRAIRVLRALAPR